MTTASKIPFTKDAYQKLQTNFDRLTKERKEVLIRLKDAREQGDLSENGAYKYAKFELGSISRQLRELRYLLESGEVVEKTASEVVQFGCTVTLADGEKEVQYLMVSKHESNPTEGKLSIESPLGLQLMGKPINTEVNFTVPSGTKHYRIIRID